MLGRYIAETLRERLQKRYAEDTLLRRPSAPVAAPAAGRPIQHLQNTLQHYRAGLVVISQIFGSHISRRESIKKRRSTGSTPTAVGAVAPTSSRGGLVGMTLELGEGGTWGRRFGAGRGERR